MRILENGDFMLDDGTIIPADQITEKYKEKLTQKSSKSSLKIEEGSISDVIRLED